MSDVYRELLADPVPRRFVAAAAVGRLPMSMLGIATVLTVSSMVRSYSLAGAVSATMLLSQCVTAPVIGRLADRLGQARVLRPVIALHVSGLLAMVTVVVSGLGSWPLFAAGVIAGGSFPPIGSFVRTRWRHRVGHGDALRAAFSLEAAIDELVYIVGPLLVVLLAWLVAPWAGLVMAALLTAMGGLAFSGMRSSQPPPSRVASAKDSAPRQPRLLLLMLAGLGFGSVIGSIEVSMVAFGEQEGSRLISGPLIAVFSVGSILAGLCYGARRWTIGRWQLLLGATVLLAASTVPLWLVADVRGMALAIAFAGFAFAPALILTYELVDELVSVGRETQGFAWIQTSLGGGLAAGAGLAGQIIESHSPARGFVFATAAATLAAVVITVGTPIGRPHALPKAGDHAT